MFPTLKKITIISLAFSLFAVFGSCQADEKTVLKLAAKKTSILKKKHKKAKKALVNAAQSTVFKDYFSATDPAQKADLKKKIDNISLQVQSKFKVDEMCMIDHAGQEISRIVADKIAPDNDLSNSEAEAPFFAPAFKLKKKQVVVTPIYMSADVNRWVVAYTTPFEFAGKKPGILHFEHSLDQYRDILEKDTSDKLYVLVLTPEGYILLDSRKEIANARKGDSEKLADYFAKINFTDTKDLEPLTSKMLAAKKASGPFSRGSDKYFAASGKAGLWTVVVIEKQ